MITKAAVEIEDLRQNKIIIIPCHRHSDAFKILKEFGYKINIDYKIKRQGFLNEHDQFLTREAVYFEAKNNGQIISTTLKNELFSEDLY